MWKAAHLEIIYHPVDALAVSAQQWDSVFGAHEVPPNPMAPVNAAWDWIDRHRLRCMLPAINEDHLYEALKRRDSRAAGGIDGWATIELPSLPPCAFRPLALYCAAVENGSRVPIAAATARQVMLPKKPRSPCQTLDQCAPHFLNHVCERPVCSHHCLAIAASEAAVRRDKEKARFFGHPQAEACY